jgi:hypothetical protein
MDIPSTIYACTPLPTHKRVACTLCGAFIGEPLVHYFLEENVNLPVCKRCAVRDGFFIWRPRHGSLWCQRNDAGIVEVFQVDV